MFVKWRFCELLCNLVASDCVHRLHRKGAEREEAGGGRVVSREWARPQTSTSLAQKLCQNTHDMCVQYVSTNGRQI